MGEVRVEEHRIDGDPCWAAAFERAMDAAFAICDDVVLLPRTYRTTRTIRVSKPVVVRGPGAFNFVRAWILVDGSHHGIWIDRSDCEFIRVGVKIRASRLDEDPLADQVGWEIDDRALLKHCKAIGGRHGFRVHSSMRSEQSNSNGFRMVHCRTADTGHAGIMVRGPDVNLGVLDQPSVIRSCRQGSLYVASVQRLRDDLKIAQREGDAEEIRAAEHALASYGYLEHVSGLTDLSFLGIEVRTAHISDTRDDYSSKPWPGARSRGKNQRSVWTEAYFEERVTGPGVLDHLSVAVGGKGPWRVSGGLVLSGRDIYQAKLHYPVIYAVKGMLARLMPSKSHPGFRIHAGKNSLRGTFGGVGRLWGWIWAQDWFKIRELPEEE